MAIVNKYMKNKCNFELALKLAILRYAFISSCGNINKTVRLGKRGNYPNLCLSIKVTKPNSH